MSSLKDRVDNHHCVGCSEKLSWNQLVRARFPVGFLSLPMS
jgi:hypothetical protein